MNILGFIEIRGNSELLCIGTDVTQCRMSGLLHHISQVSRQFQFTGTIHHINFHFQRFAANTRPGKAGNQTHLVCAGQPVRQIFPNPQEGLQV